MSEHKLSIIAIARRGGGVTGVCSCGWKIKAQDRMSVCADHREHIALDARIADEEAMAAKNLKAAQEREIAVGEALAGVAFFQAQADVETMRGDPETAATTRYYAMRVRVVVEMLKGTQP